MNGQLALMPPETVLECRISAEELASLRHMHALCRNEVHRNDSHSISAVGGLEILLEVEIARIAAGGGGDPRQAMVNHALEWIGRHFFVRRPLAKLAEHLGVSPATVQRLFRQQLGTTVMKRIAEERRAVAERMLAGKGAMIKEVAFELGYRHPHDFSRAFRNFTGSLPSRQVPKAG